MNFGLVIIGARIPMSNVFTFCYSKILKNSKFFMSSHVKEKTE